MAKQNQKSTGTGIYSKPLSGAAGDNIAEQTWPEALKELKENFDEKLKKMQVDFNDNFRDKVDKNQLKTTEILAIFITLFTFISVNVNIFTHVKDLVTAIIFMLIMTLCSCIILSFMFTLIEEKRRDRNMNILIFSLIILAGIALALSIRFWNPTLNTQN